MSRNSSAARSLKSFPCPECSSTFTEKPDLFSHLKSAHSIQLSVQNLIRSFKCTKCEADFKLKGQLKAHMLLKHRVRVKNLYKKSGIRPFTCFECGLRFKTKGHLMSHLGQKHGIFPKRIKKNKRGRKKKEDKTKTVSDVEEEVEVTKPYHCIKCTNAHFKFKHHLKLHYIVKHNAPKKDAQKLVDYPNFDSVVVKKEQMEIIVSELDSSSFSNAESENESSQTITLPDDDDISYENTESSEKTDENINGSERNIPNLIEILTNNTPINTKRKSSNRVYHCNQLGCQYGSNISFSVKRHLHKVHKLSEDEMPLELFSKRVRLSNETKRDKNVKKKTGTQKYRGKFDEELRLFPCHRCGFKFKQKFHLIRHLQIVHHVGAEEAKKFGDEAAQNATFLKSQFGESRQTEDETNSYQANREINSGVYTCEYCDKVYRRKDFFATHLKNFHNVSEEELPQLFILNNSDYLINDNDEAELIVPDNYNNLPEINIEEPPTAQNEQIDEVEADDIIILNSSPNTGCNFQNSTQNAVRLDAANLCPSQILEPSSSLRLSQNQNFNSHNLSWNQDQNLESSHRLASLKNLSSYQNDNSSQISNFAQNFSSLQNWSLNRNLRPCQNMSSSSQNLISSENLNSTRNLSINQCLSLPQNPNSSQNLSPSQNSNVASNLQTAAPELSSEAKSCLVKILNETLISFAPLNLTDRSAVAKVLIDTLSFIAPSEAKISEVKNFSTNQRPQNLSQLSNEMSGNLMTQNPSNVALISTNENGNESSLINNEIVSSIANLPKETQVFINKVSAPQNSSKEFLPSKSTKSLNSSRAQISENKSATNSKSKENLQGLSDDKSKNSQCLQKKVPSISNLKKCRINMTQISQDLLLKVLSIKSEPDENLRRKNIKEQNSLQKKDNFTQVPKVGDEIVPYELCEDGKKDLFESVFLRDFSIIIEAIDVEKNN